MTLYTGYPAGTNWTYDNWGTNPASTIGTSVTPGATNAEGSWTQLASSANIANDVYGFYLQVHSGATSGQAKNHLLDIGVDPAGGTSYTAIISNLVCGASPALTAAGAREFYFPMWIKSGSSVAARIQGSNGTAGTVRVAARFYGKPTNPLCTPVCTYSETLGTITNSSGVSFTPGNAADGSWVSLGTTARPCWWWQLGYQVDNGTITAEYTYIELAHGDGSNKHTMFKVMHGGTTGETCGLACQTNLLWIAACNPVPAGIIDDSRTLIAGPWTCTSGATGADWATGLVVVPVDGTDTTDAFTGGRTLPFNGCRMEVKVVSGATSITRRSTEKFQLAKAAV